MTREEARARAEETVFVYYTIGDINDACESRGLRVKSKSRHEKEKALIEAMTKEMTTEE